MVLGDRLPSGVNAAAQDIFTVVSPQNWSAKYPMVHQNLLFAEHKIIQVGKTP